MIICFKHFGRVYGSGAIRLLDAGVDVTLLHTRVRLCCFGFK